MNYRFQNLLHWEDGKARGAMSPMLSAQEAAKEYDLIISGLGRIWFDDDEVNNEYELPGKKCLTGFDTLVILSRHENCNILSMFVDMGSRIVPVAIWFDNDPDITVTPVYQERPFAKKLDSDQIMSLFKNVLPQFPKP